MFCPEQTASVRETNICGHFPVEITVISCIPSTVFYVCPYVMYNIKVFPLRRADLVFVIPSELKDDFATRVFPCR